MPKKRWGARTRGVLSSGERSALAARQLKSRRYAKRARATGWLKGAAKGSLVQGTAPGGRKVTGRVRKFTRKGVVLGTSGGRSVFVGKTYISRVWANPRKGARPRTGGPFGPALDALMGTAEDLGMPKSGLKKFPGRKKGKRKKWRVRGGSNLRNELQTGSVGYVEQWKRDYAHALGG